MSSSIIAYDKDLPEIPGRCPWLKPDCFLVKDPKEPTGWRVDKSGRRQSKLLLISKLRRAVDAWRAEGYPGAEPNLHTREVRNLPEPGEMRANTKPPDAPTTPVDLSSCAFCEGSGWVCSDHPSLPFEPSAPQSSCSPCLCNPNAALRWHATCPAVTH